MTPDVYVHEADTWTETSLDKQNGANSQESLVLFSNVRYAVVSVRKEWEKQGWSSEHGGEIVTSKVFLVESDQHVCSKEEDATWQSYCKGT